MLYIARDGVGNITAICDNQTTAENLQALIDDNVDEVLSDGVAEDYVYTIVDKVGFQHIATSEAAVVEHITSTPDIEFKEGSQFYGLPKDEASVGFQEINVKPFKDMELMTPGSNEKIEKTIAANREAIGADKHETYQKSFNEAYYAGSPLTEQAASVESSYQKFVFDNAQKFSLSSLRSTDQAGWEKADEAFLDQVAHKSCEKNVELEYK